MQIIVFFMVYLRSIFIKQASEVFINGQRHKEKRNSVYEMG